MFANDGLPCPVGYGEYRRTQADVSATFDGKDQDCCNRSPTMRIVGVDLVSSIPIALWHCSLEQSHLTSAQKSIPISAIRARHKGKMRKARRPARSTVFGGGIAWGLVGCSKSQEEPSQSRQRSDHQTDETHQRQAGSHCPN